MNYITHNIAKSAVSFPSSQYKYLHILSDNSRSLFSNYISSIEDILVSSIHDNNSYCIPQDVILCNNPIEFANLRQHLNILHINNIVYFHDQSPNNFKKEDKFLLSQSLKYAYKVFTTKQSVYDWGFGEDSHTCIMNYGVPKVDNTIIQKTRSVVVLNLLKNSSINMLFQYIKNVFKDAIMIDNINNNNIEQALKESAICIDAECYYNALVAISHGCYVVTSLDHIKENGLFLTINTYNNIIEEISSLLQKYDYNIAINNKNEILQKYSHDTFKQSFIDLVKKAKREPYIYAKNY